MEGAEGKSRGSDLCVYIRSYFLCVVKETEREKAVRVVEGRMKIVWGI